ncbi:MAG: TusE/DsrC/DsvC family sulfur relay protein [Planctomycetota bacterium]|nr:MAG: TusE/DsrC/DsvC family sulfur relay protein [Planctomycetota bacterium]
MTEPDQVKKQIEEKLDCDGFLADEAFWSTDVAEYFARAQNIGEHKLSSDHWKVIHFVRDYYREYKRSPAIVKVARHTSLSLEEICNLFPCGLVKGAYRLAGLPKPPGCA